MNPILLVGESNPYGADPEFALYPLPENASGGRLARILGLSRTDYLRRHDRTNLCVGAWNRRSAEENALRIHAERPEGSGIVLCGVKVAEAFRRAAAYTEKEFQPFSLAVHEPHHYLTLPHPSGLNRRWAQPGAVEDARRLYLALCAVVGNGDGARRT